LSGIGAVAPLGAARQPGTPIRPTSPVFHPDFKAKQLSSLKPFQYAPLVYWPRRMQRGMETMSIAIRTRRPPVDAGTRNISVKGGWRNA